MIARIAGRDSDACVMVFARGSYQFGSLDAGLAGTASLAIPGGASGANRSVIKRGSLVHIFPQYDFGHWHGLITTTPEYSQSDDTYRVHATELHAFLSDIDSISTFDAVAGSQDEQRSVF